MQSTSVALLTRRGFVGSGVRRTAAATLLSSVTMTRCAAPPPGELQPAREEHKLTGIESTAPSEALAPLDAQRLLATVQGPQGQGLAGRISEDLGKTWSEPFFYRQMGKPMQGGVYPERTTVRLQSGELGMVYYTVAESPAGYAMRQWFYATSSDEGKNWSAGSALDVPVPHDPAKGIYSAFLFGDLHATLRRPLGGSGVLVYGRPKPRDTTSGAVSCSWIRLGAESGVRRAPV